MQTTGGVCAAIDMAGSTVSSTANNLAEMCFMIPFLGARQSLFRGRTYTARNTSSTLFSLKKKDS
jgi:hypothetical protein